MSFSLSLFSAAVALARKRGAIFLKSVHIEGIISSKSMQKSLTVSQGNLMQKYTFNQMNLILGHVFTDLTNSRKDPNYFKEKIIKSISVC